LPRIRPREHDPRDNKPRRAGPAHADQVAQGDAKKHADGIANLCKRGHPADLRDRDPEGPGDYGQGGWLSSRLATAVPTASAMTI
jgi:hypothetical protein